MAAEGFIAIEAAQGHPLQVKIYLANVLSRHDQTISTTIKYTPLAYRTGTNRKRSEQSMNEDHKSLETVFSIAICRQVGQSTTLVLMILDLHLSMVLIFSIAAYLSEVFIEYRPTEYAAKSIQNKGYEE